jgi:WD40 repeat protein
MVGQRFEYDVFLSHNSSDKPDITAVAERLEKFGLKCFLDAWNLVPGGNWQAELEVALKQSETAAVFYGGQGEGPWHGLEIRALIDRAARERNEFRLIPVLLPGGDPTEVGLLLRQFSWVDLRAGLDDAEQFALLVAGIKGVAPAQAAPVASISVDPYRGLERFEREQAEFFFGRDDDIRRLCRAVEEMPFTAVVGASGSGKSSLIRAGLKTRLAKLEHPRLADAATIMVLPGSEPLRALADQVAAAALPDARRDERPGRADEYVRRLRERSDGLRVLLRSLFPGPTAVVLVVIDQFEEIFTHRNDRLTTPLDPDKPAAETEKFLALLADLAEHADNYFRTLITLRVDFLGRCLDYPALRSLLENRQLLLGELSVESLREVIVLPAQHAGSYFEKGLVERILNDVANQRGSLPMLQSALRELWHDRRCRWLTNDAYTATGGVAGALKYRADETLRRLGTPALREVARSVLLRLTTLGEGVPDTRRRVMRDQLYPHNTDPAEVDKVLQALSGAKARLLVMNNDGTIEVTHDALIQQWDQLQNWLKENRAALQTRERLRTLLDRWVAGGKRRNYLCPLGLLEEADGVLSSKQVAFDGQEVKYLRDSRRYHALRRHVLVGLTAFAVLVAAAAGFLAWLANSQQADLETRVREAKENEEKADSRRLAALSEYERDKRLDLALLLAVEAQSSATEDARQSLVRAVLTRPGLITFLPSFDGPISSVEFGPGESLAAAYSEQGRRGVMVWNLAGAPPGQTRLELPKGAPSSLAFTSGGQILVASFDESDGGGITVFDVRQRKQLARFHIPGRSIHEVKDVVFDREGKTLAAVCRTEGNNIGWKCVVWDICTRKQRFLIEDEKLPPDIHTGLGKISLSGDGKMLAIATYSQHSIKFIVDGEVTIWDLSNNRLAGHLIAKGYVTTMAFHPGGKLLAVGYHQNKGQYGASDIPRSDGVQIWTVPSTSEALPTWCVSSIGLAVPVGSWPVLTAPLLIAGGPLTESELRHSRVSEGPVSSVTFNPDGDMLAIGYANREEVLGVGGGVLLWKFRDARLLQISFPVSEGVVTGVAFHRKGTSIAAAYEGHGGNGVQVWSVPVRNRMIEHSWTMPSESTVRNVAFGLDGKTVFLGYEKGHEIGVLVCETPSGRQLVKIPIGFPKQSAGLRQSGYSQKKMIAFARAGQTVAAFDPMNYEAGVAIWDVLAGLRTHQVFLDSRPGHVIYGDWAFGGDGHSLAMVYCYGEREAEVKVYSVPDGKLLFRFPVHSRSYPPQVALAFDADGKTLAATCESEVVIWDVQKRKELFKADKSPSLNHEVLGFASNGLTLVGSERSSVVAWDVSSQKQLVRRELHPLGESEVPYEFDAITLDRTGKTVAFSYSSVYRGEPFDRFPMSSSSSVVFMELDRDNWFAVRIPAKKLGKLVFTPDGDALAVCYSTKSGTELDGIALIAASPVKWKEIAMKVANRNLTPTEWKRYFPNRSKYQKTFEKLPEPPNGFGEDAPILLDVGDTNAKEQGD